MFKYTTIISTIFVFVTLLGCSKEHVASKNVAGTITKLYYGDIKTNELVKIDLVKFKVEKNLQSSGDYPYEVTNGFDGDILLLNRKDTNIGVVKGDKLDSTIELSIKPRSVALNTVDKSILLSSTSEPAGTIIYGTDQKKVYKDSNYTKPISFGGTYATGHPLWLNEDYFFILDRSEKSVELYHKDSTTPKDKLLTSSSVHHVVYKDGYYYGSLEGIVGSVSPGIIKFKVEFGKFTNVKEWLYDDYKNKPDDFVKENWGSHHFAFNPSGKYIYVGSNEGNVFVIDKDSMDLVDTFKAGKGVGHFIFYKDVLITTNHHDNFKSIYDASNPKDNKLIKELKFDDKIYDGVTMQSHTSHIIGEYLYFTFNTDTDSYLYKVSLKDFTIVDKLKLAGRYCLMGTIPKTNKQTPDSM